MLLSEDENLVRWQLGFLVHVEAVQRFHQVLVFADRVVEKELALRYVRRVAHVGDPQPVQNVLLSVLFIGVFLHNNNSYPLCCLLMLC